MRHKAILGGLQLSLGVLGTGILIYLTTASSCASVGAGGLALVMVRVVLQFHKWGVCRCADGVPPVFVFQAAS